MKKRPGNAANKSAAPGTAQEPSRLGFVDLMLASIGAFMVVLLVQSAKIRDVTSDPYLNLVVSESILENNSLKLDQYEPFLIQPHHAIWRYREHTYNLYPLGTSLLALPAVYIANRLGWRMTDPGQSPPFLYNMRLQIIITAIVCAGIYVILYLTGRLYAGQSVSFVISTVSMLGSSLMSTLGTALWSHNFLILFTSTCIYMIARSERKPGSRLNAWFLGFLLFMAYLTRPTASLFIACVFVYLYMRSRAELLKAAGTAFFFFCLFIAFNIHEFGVPLPKYYSMWELIRFSESLRGFYGILLTPSRGLLVYSPFVIVILAGAVLHFRRIMEASRLFPVVLAWFALHLYLTAVTSWTGGWCYGARMAVDVMPAVVLISFALWRECSGLLRGKWRAISISAYIILGLIAIEINSDQGLHNRYIQAWNSTPALYLNKTMADNDPLYFNWAFPQFLSSEALLINRSYYVYRQELGEERYNELISKNGRLPGLPPITRYPLWP